MKNYLIKGIITIVFGLSMVAIVQTAEQKYVIPKIMWCLLYWTLLIIYGSIMENIGKNS